VSEQKLQAARRDRDELLAVAKRAWRYFGEASLQREPASLLQEALRKAIEKAESK
jgi:hypothetical protein